LGLSTAMDAVGEAVIQPGPVASQLISVMTLKM
jgi:hypothetical protein